MKIIIAVALMLAVPTTVVAQDSSGASALGRALGSSNTTRQNAYDREMARLAQRYHLRQEIRSERSQARLAVQTNKIRHGLENMWRRLGYSPEMASAVANTYAPSSSDQAVWLSLKGLPAKSIGQQIRKAMADRRYRLANQLLMGALINTQRHAGGAPSSK